MTLAGVAPSTSGQHKTITTRSVTPKNAPPKVPNSIVVGESEFLFMHSTKYHVFQYSVMLHIKLSRNKLEDLTQVIISNEIH